MFCLLLAASTPLLATTSASENSPPADHLHIKDRCSSCHKESLDIATLLPKEGKQACLRCHDAAEVKEIFATLAERSVVEARPTTVTAHGTRPPITLGMHTPLYYETTRIGKQPNKMVEVPAGEFIMGTNERLPDEGPQHTVYLDAFMIDQYEVTNLQYKQFIDATARRSPKHFRSRTFPANKIDHPVTYVSWYDARDYCQWAGKRLPTDQEWEKAARGTDGRQFSWGNTFKTEKANTPLRWEATGESGDTTPVGAFADVTSPYGLYDASGNVWEWTASWYKAYPGNTTFSESYGEQYKTLKGGSWFDCSFYKCGISAPVFNRSFFSLKLKNDTFGFRCAKDA